jgi:hypothetical protein
VNWEEKYYELLRMFNETKSNLESTQAALNALRVEYQKVLSDLSTVTTTMYVFIATTIVFAATTIYLALRKSRSRT